MKHQINIEYDDETMACQVGTNTQNSVMTYGILVSAFEALLVKGLAARAAQSGIQPATPDQLAAFRNAGPPK